MMEASEGYIEIKYHSTDYPGCWNAHINKIIDGAAGIVDLSVMSMRATFYCENVRFNPDCKPGTWNWLRDCKCE